MLPAIVSSLAWYVSGIGVVAAILLLFDHWERRVDAAQAASRRRHRQWIAKAA